MARELAHEASIRLMAAEQLAVSRVDDVSRLQGARARRRAKKEARMISDHRQIIVGPVLARVFPGGLVDPVIKP